MDDLERYGDYNEIEEENTPKENKLPLLTVKILVGVLVLLVSLTIGIRLFLFNYYPPSMKELYITESLAEHYSNSGEINALTQKIRIPYDHPTEGNFFCDNLIIVKEAGHLQVSVRYNESVKASMVSNYKIEDFDVEDYYRFSFRLWRSGDEENPDGYEIGRVSDTLWDSYAMYHYCLVAFDDVNFSDDIAWIRLEIFVEGAESETPFMVAIYENNADYNSFTEVKYKGDAR